MSSRNILFLLKLAIDCMDEDETYLNIGVYKGGSLIVPLCLSNQLRKAIGVDNWIKFDNSNKNQFIVENYISSLSLSDMVQLEIDDQSRFLQKFDRENKVGLVFLDGDHSELKTKEALFLLFDILNDDGLIFVDDTNRSEVSKSILLYTEEIPLYSVLYDFKEPKKNAGGWWEGLTVLRKNKGMVSKSKQTIPPLKKIAFSTVLTKNYIPYFCALLESIIKNHGLLDEMLVFITENGHFGINKICQKELLKLYSFIKFICVDKDNYAKLKNKNKNSPKYWVFENFKMNSYDKIICLDCDLICLAPLYQLMSIDCDIGMVREVQRKTSFNSGVMVIGKKTLNKEIYWDLINHVPKINFFGHDQAIINDYFFNRILELDLKFNTLVGNIKSLSDIDKCVFLHFFRKLNRKETEYFYNKNNIGIGLKSLWFKYFNLYENRKLNYNKNFNMKQILFNQEKSKAIKESMCDQVIFDQKKSRVMKKKIFDPKPRWESIIDIIKENKFKKIAEVGIGEGKTTFNIVKKCDLLLYLAIDATIDHDLELNLQNYDSIEIFNLLSVDAAEKIENNFLDLVFIDANHQYLNVQRDILSWMPKIREGGIICGHDYGDRWPGVIKAVDELFPNKIINLIPDTDYNNIVSVWWIGV